MSEPMRDRLLDACHPYSERTLARVLAVLADPDDETALAIYRAISLAESLDDAPCAALAALVEHLRDAS